MSSPRLLNLVILSWNIFGYEMPDLPRDPSVIQPLLQPYIQSSPDNPTLLVIGTQENYILSFEDGDGDEAERRIYTSRGDLWECEVLDPVFESESGFVKIGSCALKGAHVVAYFRKGAAVGSDGEDLECVLSGRCRVAVSDMGNKGGAALEIEMRKEGAVLRRMLFFCCHLIPHQEEWRARDANYHHSMLRLGKFAQRSRDPESNAQWASYVADGQDFAKVGSSDSSGSGLITGKDDPRVQELFRSAYDAVFFFGDLNCRVDVSREEMDKVVLDPQVLFSEAFQAKDQLNQSRKDRLSAFVEFYEPEIRFFPSFKFDAGTTIYDTSWKRRVPAWCDRVLYIVKGEEEGSSELLRLQEYTCRKDILWSDHKPVHAKFEMKLA